MSLYAIAIVEATRLAAVPTDTDLRLYPLDSQWQVACLPLSEQDLAIFSGNDDRDPVWLAQALARQHGAIAQLSGALPVYPLVFGTLLGDFDALREAVASSQPLLCSYFAQVNGCGEWGLRIRASAESLEPPAPTESGLAWLQHRRDAGLRRQERRRERLETALALVSTHLDALLRGRTERPVSGALAEDPQLLLNIALLVPFAAEQALEVALQALDDALAAHGMSLRMSGPWAPYSFRPRLGEAAL